MKLYFDHRTCDAVSVSIFINDEYIGKTRIRKERVTSVELPAHTERVRLSFSTASTSSKRIKKEEWENIDFAFEKEIISIERKLKKQEWQYPYDVEIDILKYREDIVLYPAKFEAVDSATVLFYKACKTIDGAGVELRLLKRKESFGIKKYRNTSLLISSAIFLVAGAFLFYKLNHYVVDYLPNIEAYENFYKPDGWEVSRYMDNLILDSVVAVAGIISSLCWILNLLCYKGMYREEKMKDTYIFTERGEIKES